MPTAQPDSPRDAPPLGREGLVIVARPQGPPPTLEGRAMHVVDDETRGVASRVGPVAGGYLYPGHAPPGSAACGRLAPSRRGPVRAIAAMAPPIAPRLQPHVVVNSIDGQRPRVGRARLRACAKACPSILLAASVRHFSVPSSRTRPRGLVPLRPLADVTSHPALAFADAPRRRGGSTDPLEHLLDPFRAPGYDRPSAPRCGPERIQGRPLPRQLGVELYRG